MKTYAAYPGKPYPLGATWDGSGVNFALFSENAEAVDLCIFDEAYGATEVARIRMADQTDFVWHAYLPEARPGLMYGYRVYGPYNPHGGDRYNPNKLLLDPYAKATTGRIQWSDAMFGYPLDGSDDADLEMDVADSAPGMPKAVVIEQEFSWGDDRPPNIPWHETIIYEAHVKGLTRLRADLPETRGTYAAVGAPSTVRYLRELGITAIELMPVHQFVDDKHLIDRGLRNYWGYNSIGFFAPDPEYATATTPNGRVTEFKTMVKKLHEARIEVILDVVYNHTAEGNQLGPTLSFRGIDNRSYYRLMPDEPRYYMDFTGTGNTLNMLHPRTIQIIMDSLRYWVLEMHVDGFRFDLASALARELYEVNQLSSFFGIIHQDPVLSQVKLIAEPWDVGEGGYQVGNFPVLWAEWNAEYRDSIRRFWRGDPGEVNLLTARLLGSSDLYEHTGRKPHASINFVTAHDGFTLRDLVSYNEKHNEANGENSNDGRDDNLSWNCGVEGETDDPAIQELRGRQMRNFLTTLFVSQGVPMLLHGDEVARTQGGNNNTYSQDNEMSWMPWDLTTSQGEMLDWTRRMIHLRREQPILHRRDFFSGQRVSGTKDVAWLRPDGVEMTEQEWGDATLRAITVWLAGAAADQRDEQQQPVLADTIAILINAGAEPIEFRLPATRGMGRWQLVADTGRPAITSESHLSRGRILLIGRAMAVLKHRTRTVADE